MGVVGRATEVARHRRRRQARWPAAEGARSCSISGEAGLGKTTLVAEAARAAFDSGACVLFGHCEEDLATPYQLFAEALGHYVTHAPEEQLLAHVEAHGSELARLVPALASRIPDLPPSKATDADTERFLLFAAVVGLLGRWVGGPARRSWCSTTSSGPTRGACCCSATWPRPTCRCGCSSSAPTGTASCPTPMPWWTRWPRSAARTACPGSTWPAWTTPGCMALMEAAAGHALDDAGVGLAHAIYRETDGNPFFVSEVLRNLSRPAPSARTPSGRWVAEATLDVTALPD